MSKKVVDKKRKNLKTLSKTQRKQKDGRRGKCQ